MVGEERSSDASASIRGLAKGGSVLFAGIVIELGISFLATLIIARVLGRVGFGAVSLGRTTMTLVSTVLLLGLDTGIGRYPPRRRSFPSWRGRYRPMPVSRPRRSTVESSVIVTRPSETAPKPTRPSTRAMITVARKEMPNSITIPAKSTPPPFASARIEALAPELPFSPAILAVTSHPTYPL